MPKHRGGVLTRYGAVTPLCPTGYCGTGPSASLGVLALAHGYAFELSPTIWPRGASNAARPTFATAFLDEFEYSQVSVSDGFTGFLPVFDGLLSET